MLIALAVVAAVIGVVLFLSYYTFYTCFYSPTNRKTDPYSLLSGSQYEAVKEQIFACTRIMDLDTCKWVYTDSFDGLTLAGRYYHTADRAPLLILFHGYRSMSLRDCAGGYLLGKKLGFNVLAVDERAHCESGGNVISFGIHERRDCLAWIRFALSSFGSDTQIVLSGLSMGAATVLMASALDLPENVAGILADCPYSSPADIIRKVCRDRHLPDHLAYPFILLGARIFGGFDLEETTACNAVKKAKVPILLLHGEDDRFVPCEMSRQIHNCCRSDAQLHTFPGAGHGLCYMVDPVRYETVTIRFLCGIPGLRKHMQSSDYAKKMLDNAAK